MSADRQPLLAVAGAPQEPPAPTARRVARGLLVASGVGAAFVAGACVGPALAAAPHRRPAPTEFLAAPGEAARPAAAVAVPAASLYDLEERLEDPFALIADDTLRALLERKDLPVSFDTRSEWLGCGLFVVDQGQCGDCWAASAANTLGDRACIHLKADRTAFNLSRGGAQGAGSAERLFQASGRCVGEGTMRLAHQHGCQRQVVFPSPQQLVSCGNMNSTAPPTYRKFPEGSGYVPGQTLYPESAGCNGGEAGDAWRFFYHEGVAAMDGTQAAGCTPYTSGLCSGDDPKNNGCRACAAFEQCADTGRRPEPVTVESFGWIMEEGLPPRDGNHTNVVRPASQRAAMERQVKKMQVEMLANGPLHVCIDDYANFIDFFNSHPSGIYNSTDDSPNDGGHCIELVGWGVDRASGLPYWTFKNSWGPKWANNGFGRFLRGGDLCGIESDVWAGCPSGSSCRLSAGVVRNESYVPSAGERPQASANGRGHATSALQPSRGWPGGREVELPREAFSHGHVAPLVASAVRHAIGDESLGQEASLARASRVWSRSARGLRVRVEVRDAAVYAVAHRHPEGHVSVA